MTFFSKSDRDSSISKIILTFIKTLGRHTSITSKVMSASSGPVLPESADDMSTTSPNLLSTLRPHFAAGARSASDPVNHVAVNDTWDRGWGCNYRTLMATVCILFFRVCCDL